MVQTLVYWVYITASKKRGTIYVGMTSDLPHRATQHRDGALPGFTKQYGVTRLVYFETFDDVHAAMARERQLKMWMRAWKIAMIEKANPEWFDLSTEIADLREGPAS